MLIKAEILQHGDVLLHFDAVNIGAKWDCCRLGNKINGMLSRSKGGQKAAGRLKIRPNKVNSTGGALRERQRWAAAALQPLLPLHRDQWGPSPCNTTSLAAAG